ncbi:MAG: zf-TFIIB domain-containing protein [Phormidesmis sp. RL_2_1]|nr:zf-TFIIB domain-containing protein [Phormidesmis sp. RL_2_1]
MKCPICHDHSLEQVSLDTGLLAHQCHQCLGHWIPSQVYWKWLDQREQQQAHPQQSKIQPTQPQQTQLQQRSPLQLSFGNHLLPVCDNTTANFCADCSRLMTKSKVGRGLSFYIDRCSHCHGVWLDQNEWENLKQQNLHDHIHYIFQVLGNLALEKNRRSITKPLPNQALYAPILRDIEGY